jgi:AraC-like DNA-binding protein
MYLLYFLFITKLEKMDMSHKAHSDKHRLSPNSVDLIPFSEQVDKTRVPKANDYLIERHVPDLFDTPYHHHTSVEVNFLQDCEMTYSFSGAPAPLKPDRLTVFWGAAPHRVIDVVGKGQITNIYLSLGQFIRWGLPKEMVDAVLGGAIIMAKPTLFNDADWFNRLYSERAQKTKPWQRVHLDEIEARLRRLALEGWETLVNVPGLALPEEISHQAMTHVEVMLRYVADHFTIPVTAQDIAAATNLSTPQANALFRQIMGTSMKQHLMRTRLSHSRMLLTETDSKVANIALDSGFATLSAFYEAFTKSTGETPAQYRRTARKVNPFMAKHSKV